MRAREIQRLLRASPLANGLRRLRVRDGVVYWRNGLTKKTVADFLESHGVRAKLNRQLTDPFRERANAAYIEERDHRLYRQGVTYIEEPSPQDLQKHYLDIYEEVYVRD